MPRESEKLCETLPESLPVDFENLALSFSLFHYAMLQFSRRFQAQSSSNGDGQHYHYATTMSTDPELGAV